MNKDGLSGDDALDAAVGRLKAARMSTLPDAVGTVRGEAAPLAFSSFSLRFGRVGVALCSFMAFHAARLASCRADEREGMREFHARGGNARRSSKSRQIQSLLGLLRPLRGSASPRATLAFARLVHGRGAVSGDFPHTLSRRVGNSGDRPL